MTIRLILGAVFVGLSTWLAWVASGWRERAERAREQAERARLDRFRQLSPEAPRAAGLRGDHRRIG